MILSTVYRWHTLINLQMLTYADRLIINYVSKYRESLSREYFIRIKKYPVLLFACRNKRNVWSNENKR